MVSRSGDSVVVIASIGTRTDAALPFHSTTVLTLFESALSRASSKSRPTGPKRISVVLVFLPETQCLPVFPWRLSDGADREAMMFLGLDSRRNPAWIRKRLEE
jgi:hypothetical protein